MIRFTSDDGRIGELWWFNSNTQPRQFSKGEAPHPVMEGMELIQSGTFGFGRNVSMNLTAAER